MRARRNLLIVTSNNPGISSESTKVFQAINRSEITLRRDISALIFTSEGERKRAISQDKGEEGSLSAFIEALYAAFKGSINGRGWRVPREIEREMQPSFAVVKRSPGSRV